MFDTLSRPDTQLHLHLLRRSMGAYLIEVPAVPYKNPMNYVHIASRLSKLLRERTSVNVFYAEQWDNTANRQAHIDTTGPEIEAQIKGLGKTLDAFSCAMGTGTLDVMLMYIYCVLIMYHCVCSVCVLRSDAR